MQLHFSTNNTKLAKLALTMGRKVTSFSLRSGHSCPYAKDCHSQVVDGHIVDGPHTQFRCFSASQEALFKGVLKNRQENEAILTVAAQSTVDASRELAKAIPRKIGIVRIHVGGDFKTQAYFDSWLETAERRPDVLFYAYTKSLPFWVKRLGNIPSNFSLTASYGGYRDELIADYNLRFSRVVFSVTEAKQLGLPIDDDDSHAAIKNDTSFALLLHGVQPKGSVAAQALQLLKQ